MDFSSEIQTYFLPLYFNYKVINSLILCWGTFDANEVKTVYFPTSYTHVPRCLITMGKTNSSSGPTYGKTILTITVSYFTRAVATISGVHADYLTIGW